MQDLGISVLFKGINFYRVLGGLWITTRIALIAIVLSVALGIAFGLIMLSKSRLIKIISRFYLEAVRIIPTLVWLFVFYFGVTKMFNIHISGELTCIIVFTLWGTAEMGDLVRGSVTSLPVHQKESGKAIGLTMLQIYWYIIIPQAMRRLIPGAINLATRMVKTTSLAILVGVAEVLKVGQQVIESSIIEYPTASLWVYGFIFFLYFIICYPISLLSKRLEVKWQDYN